MNDDLDTTIDVNAVLETFEAEKPKRQRKAKAPKIEEVKKIEPTLSLGDDNLKTVSETLVEFSDQLVTSLTDLPLNEREKSSLKLALSPLLKKHETKVTPENLLLITSLTIMLPRASALDAKLGIFTKFKIWLTGFFTKFRKSPVRSSFNDEQ